MKKQHLIALVIAAVVVGLFIPLGFFSISMETPLMSVLGMAGAIIGTVAAVMIGSTEPSDSADHH